MAERVGRQRKKLAQVARLWARGQIHTPDPEDDNHARAAPVSNTTETALAHFGVVAVGDVPAPVEYPTFHLWPCNVATYNLWLACQTQWVRDMQGRCGLNYQGVEVVMRRMRLRGEAADRHFFSLQTMEIAAINVWAEQQQNPTPTR